MLREKHPKIEIRVPLFYMLRQHVSSYQNNSVWGSIITDISSLGIQDFCIAGTAVLGDHKPHDIRVYLDIGYTMHERYYGPFPTC